ncbi:MAG TPA: OmpA family protein [Ideonella sp.]|jgi:outer membrane protein OmpA-like peptidoglycan-associated protein|nr:OmpA family protein [Ideonella sp.]
MPHESQHARPFLRALLALATLLTAGALHAADVPWGTEVPGGQDHPLVRRFTGAWLVGYQRQSWDQVVWPTSPVLAASDKLKDVATLEGQITRLVYLAPLGKSPLEVYRNHEQAFTAAGFKRDFACELDCDKLYWAWYKHVKPVEGLRWQTQGSIPAGEGSGRYSMGSSMTPYHGRFWVGSALRGGETTRVLLYSGDAANEKTGIATVYLQIVEPKPMATGQVVVADATALQAGLTAEGKATLGGLVFDSGKAELKPESKPQLEAMAALLKAQPTWRVFIVGHTDNVGSVDANQALSQQRAQAVAAALAAPPYAVDPKRLAARGVANIAPVASNADEAGRSRNRRVEMVLQ